MFYSNCEFFVPISTTKIVGGTVNISNLPKLYPGASELWQQYVPPSLWDEYKKFFTPGEIIPPTTLFDEIRCTLKYDDKIKDYNRFNANLRNKIHIGQLKLYLSELQALNNILKNYNDKATVIYAGAAPSMKLWMLMQMFPHVKFVLVDPNEFNVYDGRYGLPHYVRQDPDYIEHGDKWGVYKDKHTRATNAEDYIYLSYSDSNMYESSFYKNKNLLWYDPNERKLVKRNKPTINSGYGKSFKDIQFANRDFNVFEKASQASFDYVFQSNHRVYFVEEYFTDDMALKVRNAADKAGEEIVFFTDLRTSIYNKSHPTDTDIMMNSAWIINWLITMEPEYSMIKFRLPFREKDGVNWDIFSEDLAKVESHGIPFRSTYEKNGNMLFFDGVIELQAWEGDHSTETRLVVKRETIKNLTIKEWKLEEYEDRLYGYNMLERFAVFHENPLANEAMGFDNCADCAIEYKIWNDYKKKVPDFDIKKAIKKLEVIISVSKLDRGKTYGHGHFLPEKSMSDFITEVDKQFVGGDRGYPEVPSYYSDADDWRKQYTQPALWETFDKYFKVDKLYEPVFQIEDSSPELPYRSGIGGYNKFNLALHKETHRGQRKLFISELQGLNVVFDNSRAKGIVLYVGAAPSMKLYTLMNLYPNIKFVLVDPNEFNIYDGTYDLPHYVRQDPDYIEHGDKWKVYMDKNMRIRNAADYVYLSHSDSNMYESTKYKGKNILWYNPDTLELEKTSKPVTDSGVGKGRRDVEGHDEFTVKRKVNQASIDYIFNSNHRVYMLEEYFTSDIAKMFRRSLDKTPVRLAFWSDIRTNMAADGPTDTDIMMNTVLMYNWLKHLRPDISMLKFRMPYDWNIEWDNEQIGFNEILSEAKTLGYDFKALTVNKTLPFFNGEIMLQAWQGGHSTETRLIVKQSDIDADLRGWNQDWYDNKIFFYNVVGRYGVPRVNPVYMADIPKSKKLGIDCCNDCCIECGVWSDYAKRHGSFNVYRAIEELGNTLRTKLSTATHGHLIPHQKEQNIIRIAEKL
jgi:hypothetical protein